MSTPPIFETEPRDNLRERIEALERGIYGDIVNNSLGLSMRVTRIEQTIKRWEDFERSVKIALILIPGSAVLNMATYLAQALHWIK